MTNPNDPSAAPRPRKRVVLPQIKKLAGQGLSSREIGERMNVPKSTVTRWLRTARRECAAQATLDPAAVIRKKIARYQSISAKYFAAWRRSQSDKQVRLVAKTGPTGDADSGKEKRSVRAETQADDVRYLDQAIEAENRIDRLEQRLAALQEAEAGDRPLSLDELSDDDLENLAEEDFGFVDLRNVGGDPPVLVDGHHWGCDLLRDHVFGCSATCSSR